MPDVIIIGAGVVGTSIAYHLAKLGCRDVVVLEKNYIGSGSTERCPGGIRHQFSEEVNIALSIESVQFFENFEEETGHPADFRQHGYLILATSEQEMETFRRNVALQRKMGVDSHLLTPRDVKEFIPELNVDDVCGATYCPRDGYADPYSVVHGFAYAAQSLGVQIFEETEVIGIQISADNIKSVLTTKGKFEALHLMVAAGAWTRLIGKMVGLEVPIKPLKRHTFITEPIFNQPNPPKWSKYPMIIDFHNGFWIRREGPCLLFGMRNPDELPGFSLTVDWAFLNNTLAPVACHRMPLLGNTGLMRGQAGLHSDTPDYMAILGEVPGIKGLYLACGFSGHGFMHSPAVGRLIAELILGKIKSLPSNSAFSLERFQSHAMEKEVYFI